jgi:pimeloyl-ACP methyl ester carboxylesterase
MFAACAMCSILNDHSSSVSRSVFAALEPHFIWTPDVIPHWMPHAQQTTDLRGDLRGVRCPTLVLIGEHDPLNPPALGAEIVEAIPNGRARLEIVPDASHRVFVDDPEHAHDCIRAFLTDPS